MNMDVIAYVGIGTAIGAAVGGVSVAIVKIRNQRYSVSKDEFKTLISEVKEERNKDRLRIEKLEQRIDQCEEEKRLVKTELAIIKKRVG